MSSIGSWVYYAIFLVSVLVSSISQILLKKEALKPKASKIKEYLNISVIVAYALFFGSTLLTTLAYKGVNLSAGPLLEATGYIYIAILSVLFLNEKITIKKLIGNALIIFGIIIYTL